MLVQLRHQPWMNSADQDDSEGQNNGQRTLDYPSGAGRYLDEQGTEEANDRDEDGVLASRVQPSHLLPWASEREA